MYRKDEYYLKVLLENGGFDDPHKWVRFAKKHNFQKIKSQKLHRCPSCKNGGSSIFAQYIYYSNIFHINRCANCGLYFSDRLLAPEIISQHFENAYKDEGYFNEQRKHIFKYIAQLADTYTPLNGKVLDIGGGKGHLLNIFSKIRPDTEIKLNDLSLQSCEYCSETFGIDSICCAISDLKKNGGKFNTILLIDVIYYEPQLNEMFDTISNLLGPDQGALIIRIPNKLELIKIFQLKLRYFSSHKKRSFQNTVRFFNPEHIYIFSKYYINARLKKLGFSKVTFIPSPSLCKRRNSVNFGMQILFWVSKVINKLTFGKLILTPSMIVIATR